MFGIENQKRNNNQKMYKIILKPTYKLTIMHDVKNFKAMHEVEIEILKQNQHEILWSKKYLKCMK
jgi:hypothetical protein